MPKADLDWAISDVKMRAPHYELARRYDEGRHRLLFASEKFRNAFGLMFREFADNFCDDVVDANTDRLQIIGWTSNDEVLDLYLDEAWEANHGASRTGAIHRHAYREGDGFGMVQETPDHRGRMFKMDPTEMAVRYSDDNPDEKAVAARVWKTGKRWRITLYYPDHLERYTSRGSSADGGIPGVNAFSPVTDQADGEARAELTRIPVYHFPNGELSSYGRSLLRGVIPVQDALNKTVADLLVDMERTALPQRHATGVELPRDPVTGEEYDPWKDLKPGELLWTKAKEARFGEFAGANLTQFLDVADSFRIAIARKGYLPPHSIVLRTGQSAASAMSGVALLVGEGRSVKLGRDRQRDWGPEHREMMAHLLSIDTLQNVTGGDLSEQWAPVETRDMKALLEELMLKKDLGVPLKRLLEEAGYTSDEAEEFVEEVGVQLDAHRAALSVLEGGRPAIPLGDARPLEQMLPSAPDGPVAG